MQLAERGCISSPLLLLEKYTSANQPTAARTDRAKSKILPSPGSFSCLKQNEQKKVNRFRDGKETLNGARGENTHTRGMERGPDKKKDEWSLW